MGTYRQFPAPAATPTGKIRTGATDGNLGAHLKKLEEAEYVAVEKRFEDRKPVTRYALTSAGREAFRRYVDRLESMISGDGGD